MYKKGDIQAFVDVDYTLDLINQKSICAYIFTISRSVVCFNNTKQKSVISSTIEVEYIALSLAF